MEILNRKQSLTNIGYAIKNHRSREVYNYSQNCAVARVSCNVANKIHPNQNGEKIYWLINDEIQVEPIKVMDPLCTKIHLWVVY